MPLEVQARLLKVIEERTFRRVGGTQTLHVDIRILAATNIDLESAARNGRFRQDLFYRLSVVPRRLPPLRERASSIGALARRLVAEIGLSVGKPDRGLSKVAQLLLAYRWPGNIRELRNLIERALLLCQTEEIEPRDLPQALRPRRCRKPLDLGGDNTLATVEATHIGRVLEAVGGNRSQAAEVLGIHRSTLIAKIKRHGLDGG